MDNVDQYFLSNYVIQPGSFFDENTVRPKNIEVVITRLPGRIKDGYSLEMIHKFCSLLKDCVSSNAFVFLLTYSPIECRWRPFEIGKTMAEYGFFQADNIIIRKRWNSGKRTDYSLTNNYEYAMFFTNGKVKILDKKPLRRYFKTPEEDCVGNVWDIQDTTLNDTVSFDLGELLIRLTNILPGSSVMNPFGGSTSLLRAVMKLGHSFYSWEGNEKNRSKFLNIIKKNKLIKEHV